MTTAALANGNDKIGDKGNSPSDPQQQLKKAAVMARGLADDASKAIGNLLPTASLQNITTRKYTLPDKSVASQVLMYRQLLHTSCRPGLKLSRQYQGTVAQKAVMHMPWWEKGIEETKKMVISYDNLITRLWLNGAIRPFAEKANTSVDLLDLGDTTTVATGIGANSGPESLLDDKGLPPVPHVYWVERLGFQQNDPVTDFRSGGVLSLAMMVYMVESCPEVCQRFFSGDASVLPFGITCINVCDMMAKFLMLAKSTDRMDALLSQRPFWKMFSDPNAILALQELSMSMLCDVVVELGRERSVPGLADGGNSDSRHDTSDGKVSVFDFSTILERTERRVRDDLLGAGPKTVEELRSIAGRLRLKYQNQLERRIQRAEQRSAALSNGDATNPQQRVSEVMAQAGNMAGGLFSKIKPPTIQLPGISPRKGGNSSREVSASPSPAATLTPTLVDLPPPSGGGETAGTPTSMGVEGDWIGTDIPPVTDAISNFSIGDEEDDDDL